MNRTFLVTGHGRSGTHFLARVLDTSPTWRVDHEAVGTLMSMSTIMIDRHYGSRTLYGMVSNYCRWHALGAKAVGKVAVILRNPFDIALSHHNRGTWSGNFNRFFERDFKAIDKLARSDRVQVIRFSAMTTDMDYLLETAKLLGITDLDPDKIDMNKKISPSRGTATKLPKKQFDKIQSVAGWFKNKWFPND